MGNCNCFQISPQQKSERNKDFILEEGNSLENNYINGEIKPYNNDSATTNGINQKFSPRGVNNPTQNNMIKNHVKSKKDSEKSISDIDRFDKLKNKEGNNTLKKNTKDKLEETNDKDNLDTFTSNYPNNNNKIVKKITKGDENLRICDKGSILSNANLNKRLTEILKLKDLSSNYRDKSNSINIVVLGDKCVGKTCIIYQYISNKFDPYYIQTMFKEEFSKVVSVNNKKYSVNITVTSGVPQYQEDYTNIYKISDFFIVCYDVTSNATFEKAKEIISKEILPYVFLYNDGYANIVLIGNKCDLRERDVDNKKVAEYCKKYNIDFYESSAKTKSNVAKIFTKILDVYDEAIDSIGK